jgi:hypothetical protein
MKKVYPFKPTARFHQDQYAIQRHSKGVQLGEET